MRYATTVVTPGFEISVQEVDGVLQTVVRQIYKTAQQKKYGGYEVVQEDFETNRQTFDRIPLLRFEDGIFRAYAVETKNTPNSDQNLGTLLFRVRVDVKPLSQLTEKGVDALVDMSTLRPATWDEIVRLARDEKLVYEEVS